MMTVKQVSDLAGVSVRTLRYYDRIGLLRPASVTEAGYRLYDERSLERLRSILLFRALEFPLKDIREILERPDFDPKAALDQQIELLTLKKEHIQNLIDFARGLKVVGGKNMDFKVFDKKKLDEYARQAKETWGNTPAYREIEEKSTGRTAEKEQALSAQMMAIFAEFGAHKDEAPDGEAAQALVKRLQAFITEHFYTCTKQIFVSLGQMYDGGGEMTENIDAAGGAGTAHFAAQAIAVFCRK